MSKQGNFHINEKGEVNPCTTTPDKCPVKGPGGERAEHFDDLQSAYLRREEVFSEEFGGFGTLVKGEGSEENDSERLDHYYSVLDESINVLDPWLYDLNRMDGDLSTLGREASEAEIVSVAEEHYKPDLEVLLSDHDLVVEEDPYGPPVVNLFERKTPEWEEDDEAELEDDVNLESLKRLLKEDEIPFSADEDGVRVNPAELTNRQSGKLSEYLETIREYGILDSKLYNQRREEAYQNAAVEYLSEKGWVEEDPDYQRVKRLLTENQSKNNEIKDFGPVKLVSRDERENYIPIKDDVDPEILAISRSRLDAYLGSSNSLGMFEYKFGYGVLYDVGEADENAISLVKVYKDGAFHFETIVDLSDPDLQVAMSVVGDEMNDFLFDELIF